MRELPRIGTIWVHLKTGHIYIVVGECQIEVTNKPGILYLRTDVTEGIVWMRPTEEFLDGRFVETED